MNTRPTFIVLAIIASAIVAIFSFAQRHGEDEAKSSIGAELRLTKAAIYRKVGTIQSAKLNYKPVRISGALSGIEFSTENIVYDDKYVEFNANGSWFYIIGITPLNNGLSAQIFSADGYPVDAWISSSGISDKNIEFISSKSGELVRMEGAGGLTSH